MQPLIDLIGQRFGRLTVIKQADSDKYRKSRWLCRCRCKQKIVIHGLYLKNGRITHCGCLSDEPGEIWKDILEYKGLYQISTHGRVKRLIGWKCSRERIIKQRWWRKGFSYLCVELCKNGKRKPYKIHRLVLETFTGPLPHGKESRHLDGNRINNHLNNLQYGTKSENTLDSVRHGTHIDIRGSKHHLAKLTEEKVLRIRQLLKDGHSGVEIARQFDVSIASISNIKLRKIWTHI